MRLLFAVVCTLCSMAVMAQAKVKVSDPSITKMVESYKTDPKGPYRDIRWFCKDGTTVSPQERCPEPGVQRARYREEVIRLGETNHVYLGQILSTTPVEDFWDASYDNSRLKQYQLEQFLRANDNGWVNRRAQYYRGAFQVEDEETWGINFLSWVLEDGRRVADHFFLIRQSAKDIPHAAESNVALNVRAISKELADEYSGFMDLRVKLHGQPEQADIERVKEFQQRNKSKLTPQQHEKFDLLVKEMTVMYKPIEITDFGVYQKKLPSGSAISTVLKGFVDQYKKIGSTTEKSELVANTALSIRQEIATPMKSSARLALLDVSNKLESLINREATAWKPVTLDEQVAKTFILTKAAAGFGYLELWEWEELSGNMAPPVGEALTLRELSDYSDNVKRSVEWGTGIFRATYQGVVSLYEGFEPLVSGFVDDKVRASVLLHLGASVSILGDFFADQAGFSNSLMRIASQSAARGLNPGYAMGELVVTRQSPEDIEVSSDKIYIFNRPPADLKPVAGIATVTEGNMVSHVQLLARNLGIPNAVVSMENLTDLLGYSGQKVFYAVSNRGTVLIKPAEEMTVDEVALFTKKARSEERITVPVELMELEDNRVINLRAIDATFSGKVCGPKAANLGQLKKLYPDHVVEGLVIPFAIFKAHFDEPMPGQAGSYWQFLNNVFEQANQKLVEGQSDMEVETFVLGELAVLQKAIKAMTLRPAFEAELRQMFREVLGAELGKIPVFIRSDTNMEDLKDFTGAGLNLTLFNVLDANKILQGIKDVWASPYTERSYKWRQKYLLNPENVFPSILIIPSVNAEASGVLITKGVSNGNELDNTVAFNRGVGGAVEGQASETWLLRANGINLLQSPAREPEYMAIPATGGTVKLHTDFKDRILTPSRLTALREMSRSLNEKLPEIGLNGPYDVELGFTGDKIWLFQVRPFVENKRAAASAYLRSITPELQETKLIQLDTRL